MNNWTLRTASPSLRDPIEFVRSVLSNMTGLYRDCVVRLACDADPQRPDYLVEMLFSDEDGGEQVIRHQPLVTISGKTHRPIANDWRRRWSEAFMTFEEVQQLVGELRRSPSQASSDGRRG